MYFRHNLFYTVVVVSMLTTACGTWRAMQERRAERHAITLDTLDLPFLESSELPYRPTPTIDVDIHHIQLQLSFDWQDEAVIGKAVLRLSPWFRALDTVRLDAKGFRIESIALRQKGAEKEFTFHYDSAHIHIIPAQVLQPNDTVEVEIHYKAWPSRQPLFKGVAIESSQGLYFINPRNEIPGKPRQIWTQGETEYNSAWFPSVDKPTEKFTQEISLTVEDEFHTVSNGRLVYSTVNGDGTRTDHWKQDLPHSNYLVMIAIGEFAVVKDEWNGKDVWYFLDKEFEPYAMDIFGNTPEMLDFYSKLLDYPYPWDKYHQVVVKDFVSGAMENTGAVIHGDFVQRTRRQLLDESHEDVIAHELFHHWFGDLVTCESWSQLTLNEGFASYSEYLWKTHKYGVDEAKLHLWNDKMMYLEEAESDPKSLVRHHYEHSDDMFDRHSYQKGSLVIHMLRQEVGDEAFFKSLQYYLKEHAFQTVESEDLRHAFEHVTGRDLRWFFNQWFDRSGHPVLRINYHWNPETRTVVAELEQKGTADVDTYQFHLDINVGMSDGSVQKQRVWVDEASETFHFPVNGQAQWYAANMEGDMLCEMQEVKDNVAWRNQLIESPSFQARYLALGHLVSEDPEFVRANLVDVCNDPFWLNRSDAIAYFTHVLPVGDSVGIQLFTQLSRSDPKSAVRAAAYIALDTLTRGMEAYDAAFVKGLSDSSYAVIGSCLSSLSERNACLALSEAKALEKEKYDNINFWIAKLYAACPQLDQLAFFDSASAAFNTADQFLLFIYFAEFAQKLDHEQIYDRLVYRIGHSALQDPSYWARLSALRGLEVSGIFYQREIDILTSSSNPTPAQQERLARLRTQKTNVDALMDELKEQQGDTDLFDQE